MIKNRSISWQIQNITSDFRRVASVLEHKIFLASHLRFFLPVVVQVICLLIELFLIKVKVIVFFMLYLKLSDAFGYGLCMLAVHKFFCCRYKLHLILFADEESKNDYLYSWDYSSSLHWIYSRYVNHKVCYL